MISYIVHIRLIIQTVTVTVLNKSVCVLSQIENVHKFVANSLQKVWNVILLEFHRFFAIFYVI